MHNSHLQLNQFVKLAFKINKLSQIVGNNHNQTQLFANCHNIHRKHRSNLEDNILLTRMFQ